MNNTEKRIDPAAVLSDIGGEMILEAAPTGAKKRSRKHILIASAATLAAAAAAVVLTITLLPKAGANKPEVKQAEAPGPEVTEAPVQAVTAEPKPEITPEPTAEPEPIRAQAIQIASAATTEEWDEMTIQNADPDSVIPGAVYQSSHGDDWTAPTPREVLGDEELSVFRGTVMKVETYELVFGGEGAEYPGRKKVSVITFLVKDCYKGSLKAGEETRVLIFQQLVSGVTFEPPIGRPGSAAFYHHLLKPGTEAIMLVHECGEDEFETCDVHVGNQGNEAVYNCQFFYRDLADCLYRRRSGMLFVDSNGRFLYDTEVYDASLFGEEPSLDSAETFIRNLLASIDL